MLLADSIESDFSQPARATNYWSETKRPFCNLIFLLPLLIAYEFGASVGDSGQGGSTRNGADAWIRHWLNQLGIEFVWIVPIVLLGIFLIWQAISQEPWRMKWDTFGGMIAESLLFAFILIMVGQLTDFAFRYIGRESLQIQSLAIPSGLVIRLVTFMGAGIYEEFLFRLCALPLVYVTLRAVMIPKNWALFGTIIASSFLFSLAHYFGPTSDNHALAMLTDAVSRVQSSRELWFGFVFRTVAGMFFATLYLLRGFGITVGAHAAYDVFVGIILVHEI